VTAYASPTAFSGVSLVAEREIRMRLRSKVFIISTLLMVGVVLAAVIISGFLTKNPEKTAVAAVGPVATVLEQLDYFDVTTVDTVDEGTQLVRSEAVDALVTGDESGYTVIGLNDVPGDVVSALSIQPAVEVLNPDALHPLLVYFVAFGFALLFFMAAMIFGQIIAQSVVEEKQTRIVEILIATLPVRVLLAGKIIGNSLLAFVQIVVVTAVAGVGMLATGQDLLLADIGPSLVWFVVFFAFGFILLAALYAALAALVSRTEDLGSALTPVTMLVMIPYFGVVFFKDDTLIMGILSYVPFAAPVAMPMRVFLGAAEWWEPLLSLALLIVTTAVTVVIGARIYSGGLLRMGAQIKIKEALKG
jgi:ABC-2 type transport system permease protein